MKTKSPRAAIFYIASIACLAIYGGQVCPFIEGLNPLVFLLTLSCYGLLAYLLRFYILRHYVLKAPFLRQSSLELRSQLFCYFFLGFTLTIHNYLVYSFPIGSGVKLMVGVLTLGFFAAVDLGLERERFILAERLSLGKSAVPDGEYRPITKSFAAFAIASVVLVTALVLLVIVRDLDWISRQGPESIAAAKKAVTLEMVFIALVLMAFLVNLVLSFSRNLRFFFQNQVDILDRVAHGLYDEYVPVASGNEFGLMANHTNKMIDKLAESYRIKDALGKVVSPKIRDRLLARKGGVRLEGSKADVAILISDIRNFTGRTEESAPEKVVAELNIYFSEMVSIVHEHNGFVDKFIGDGMLAVFGVDGEIGAADSAVRAAFAMQDALGRVNERVDPAMSVGIGVHWGSVVAGTIGSYERLEFTVVGDTVNTAARLESLTSTLDCSILVSRQVYEQLDKEVTTHPWVDFGALEIKGRKESVHALGVVRNQQE
jgi:adenylate cyclase